MSKPVILLVDDEEDLVQVMATSLSHALPEHLVQTATSLDEALETIQRLEGTEDHLGLVLVDHVLGGRTGLELLEFLHEHHPGVPKLLFTGQASEQVEERAEQLGVRVLWKPMRLAALQDEVRRALGAGATA